MPQNGTLIIVTQTSAMAIQFVAEGGAHLLSCPASADSMAVSLLFRP